MPVSGSGRLSRTVNTRPLPERPDAPGAALDRGRDPWSLGHDAYLRLTHAGGPQPRPCNGGAGVSPAFPGGRRPDGRSSVALCQAATNSTEAGVGAGCEDRRQVQSLQEVTQMEVQFIASVAVITPNPADSRRLYLDALRPWRGRVAPSKMSANPPRAARRPQLPCSEQRPGRHRGRARRPALDPSQGEEPAPGSTPPQVGSCRWMSRRLCEPPRQLGAWPTGPSWIYSDTVASVPIAGGPRPLVRSAGWFETREAPQRIMSEAHRGARACCVDPEGQWALQRPRSPLVP